MRRTAVPLVGGLLLVTLFIGYRLFGPDLSSSLDKVVQCLLLVPAVLLIAWAISRRVHGDLARRVVDSIGAPSAAVFLVVLSAVLLAFSAWMAFGPLEGIPKGADEVAYFFQSRIFAEGHLTAPQPAIDNPRDFFPYRHFVFDGERWFGMYTPMHSLMMTPFTVAGVSALLGPVEGVLILIGIFLLIRLWAGETHARISSLLLVLSPFYLLMICTYMAHNTNLLMVTWALYYLSKMVLDDRERFGLAAGFLLGCALATKPYPIVAWGLYLTAAISVHYGKKAPRKLAILLAGSLPPVALLLLTNRHYSGSPFVTSYTMARGTGLLGFGSAAPLATVYGEHVHTPIRGLYNVMLQMAVGATILYGWPLVSGVPMLFSLKAWRKDRRVLSLFGMPVLLALFMSYHFAASIDYGPRHYFEVFPVFVLLSAVGLREFLLAARRRWGDRGGSFTLLWVAGLFMISMLLYMPPAISFRTGPWKTIDDVPYMLALRIAEAPAIVFMEAAEGGYPNLMSGLNHDSPWLDGDFVFCAHQTREEDLAFMEAYPGRNAYLFWYDGTECRLAPWTPALADSLIPRTILMERGREERYYSGE
jgi:hypothetical protein